jgi:quercetin dioxygenase-like cupin family protein
MSTTQEAKTQSAYLVGEDTGIAAVWWPFSAAVGRYTYKVTGGQSDGRLFQLLVTEGRGAAPPLHLHRDADETFYVLDGQLTFYVDGQQIPAGANDFVFVPRGCVHSYLVRSPQARMLATFGPAGIEGFFTELGIDYGREKPMPQPPDPELFGRVANTYSIEIVGPPPTLE